MATNEQFASGTKLASAGSPTSVSAAFTNPATAGRLLLAVVGANGNTTISGPSGWLTAINQSGAISQGIFYKFAVGGETSIAATVTTNPGSIGIQIYEYSDVTTFLSAGSSAGSSKTPNSGTVTTTTSNELVFAGFTVGATTTISDTSWNDAGEGFTRVVHTSTSGAGAPPDATYAGGHNLINTAGAKSVIVSFSGSSANWIGQIVRFEKDVTPPSAITNLALSNATTNSLDLTWTAPGDDNGNGLADTYDIRYSTSTINDGNFGSATPISSEPDPTAPGTSQSITISGLSPNTTYYFAMKTSDEIPNTSVLSNVPSLATLPIPDTTAPAAVVNLALSNPTVNSITLTWTAPGDDGSTGTATTYDIRRSISPIGSDSEFNAATQLSGEPTPLIAGTVQTMTATGLTAGVTYYFAMKTSDEVPNVSSASNAPHLATLPPPDTTAPATITNLALSNPTVNSITLTWTAPGDDGSTGTAALYDFHYSTAPILTNGDYDATPDIHPSAPLPAIAGTVQSTTVTGLSANTTYYFAVKTYDEVPNLSNLSNSPGLSTLAAPDVTAPSAVTDLTLSDPSTTSITLTWTAPGDDGAAGTAITYDIRRSFAQITTEDQFNSAVQLTGEPVPAIAGTSQTMTVGGLIANTTYYFAMKTLDEAPNASGLSNNPSLATSAESDAIAPAAVTDLVLSSPTSDTITLTWTAPGDDGATGTAATYDIRYSDEYQITTDVIYSNATRVTDEPIPAISGTVQSMTVTGLRSNTNYNFAIKTLDEVPNRSALSNSPHLSTLPTPDTTAPAAITNLALSNPTFDAITLTWTAPGDDGTTGTAAFYHLHYSSSPINNDTDFDAATHFSGEPTPAVAGTVQSVIVTGLNAATTYYFAMKTGDEVPNVSTLSNTPSLATAPSPDVTAPATITDLALSNPTENTITLIWTAPGDDGATGIAASYDIRYATTPINSGNFAAATQVTGEPTPLVAGTSQTKTVSGLSSNTLYYFAMKTSDEAPNASGLSNTPSLATAIPPDVTAPAAISDLVASGATVNSMVLTWTATGDDGLVGTASTYDLRYSTSSIVTNAQYLSATQVTGEPTPAVSGTPQTMTITGLSEGTTYFFAIKAIDEALHSSTISNIASRQTLSSAAASTGVSGGNNVDLILTMQAQPNALLVEGGDVTFTYLVSNHGSQHVTDIEVRDDLGSDICAPVVYVGGDTDNDGGMSNSKNEIWTFACKTHVTTSTAHTAVATGKWNYGIGSSNTASIAVQTGVVVEAPNIDFRVRAFPSVAHPHNGNLTLSYTVENLCDAPITDLQFSAGGQCELSALMKGDINNNQILDSKEKWEYACEAKVTTTAIRTIVATAKSKETVISDAQTVIISVGSVAPHPSIHLTTMANPSRLPFGGGTTYLTYHVSNDGDRPLRDVELISGSETCLVPTYEMGDLNQDGILDISENWMYTCIEVLDETEMDAPMVRAVSDLGPVSDSALFVVPIATELPPETDPTVAGDYNPVVAKASTPSIDTNLSLEIAPGFTGCVIGVPYKMADDGNPNTPQDKTVYYCGRDGRRHPFPNEKIYLSWFANFHNVVEMDAALLKAVPLGFPVTYRPGSTMVKTIENPEVYAIARGGVLRYVRDAAMAAALYGHDWILHIQDLPIDFLNHYVFGEPIAK